MISSRVNNSAAACHRWLWALLIGMLLAACGGRPQTTEGTPAPAYTPSPTPSFPIDERIRESFRQTDPDLRRESVLRVTESFLRSAAILEMSEEEASEHYTNVAFSSERMTFPDPAFIRRQDNLAVIALPDSMGVYLYDLNDPEAEVQPVQLSAWTIGMLGLEVNWTRDAIGVSFATLGNDGLTRVHFVLVVENEDMWDVAWFSDEAPDWWFNTYDASLSVSADLSRLIVIGKGLNTTDTFFEDTADPLTPVREFRVQWLREDNSYVMNPTIANFPSRDAWLWAMAEPSDYATLVEFLERLQVEDREGMLALVTDPAIIDDAHGFGLYLPERRYQIAAYSEGLIFFRDRRGAFIATFQQPTGDSGEWLLTSLKPLGAEIGPTPTPTPLTP